MKLTALLPLLAFGALGATAQAQTTLYDNTTTFAGSAFANGGAAADPAAAANSITRLIADDIQLGAGFGGATITGFTFCVANLGTAPISARARVRFYAADPTSGLPSTYITGFSFALTSYATGVGTFTFTPAIASQFVVPANGSFWAGMTFDNAGATATTTVADLNNIGQGIYNPPSVGSSQNVAFQTTANGSFLSSNPAGTTFNFGATGPNANFGWRFVGNAPVPEPASMAALGLGALALLKRRRKSA